MEYTRYLTLGLRGGELYHILARRGRSPDDIVKRTLDINSRNRQDACPRFDKLYVLTVGEEGSFGGSTNLKIQEIVPPPRVDWSLVMLRGLY